MKSLQQVLFVLILIPFFSLAQNQEWNKEQKEILNVIENQQKAWNNYDLESFMEGYWKSDQLKFYGSNGIIYGWQNTLDRYKKSYPSSEHTGTLNFVIKEISPIENESYYVMGEFHLVRSVGNADGVFMILFKKIDGKWKIIADTSC